MGSCVQFSLLQANLNEIYTALHKVDPKSNVQDLPLYATSPFHIYLSGTWTETMSQIWQIWERMQGKTSPPSTENVIKLILTTGFDNAVHCAYSARQKRMMGNMREIDELWKSTLQPQDFVEMRKRYEHYLSKEFNESSKAVSDYLVNFDKRALGPLSAQEAKAHRHTIINFHQATHVFWSLFIKNKTENIAIRQPLIHLMTSSSTLCNLDFFKALKKEWYWVEMEGWMQCTIPVAIFAKLHDPQSLTASERGCLNSWVQTLNQCQGIPPKLFACVLNEVINVIYLQGSSPLTLPKLLAWLDEQGCQLIRQSDPAHLDWREKLKFGDKIECNGKQFTLGRQLSPDKLIHDAFKVFELESHPDYVVKIAHNRLLLLVEDTKASNEQEHWGVRLVETIADIKDMTSGLDSQGCCVVLEKLSAPVDSHVWNSQKFELTKEDEKVALVLANHLFCMSQWKTTAQSLSLAHLMWDKKGLLKSTRLLKKGPGNYNDWEELCEKAAKGNPYVLSFLMNVSKLSEHKMALYYQKAVRHTLKTGETDLIGRALPLDHRQDVYNQHVKELCAQAQKLRLDCFEMISADLLRKNQYSHKQEGKLKKSIADKLLELYQVSPTPGRFPPGFEQKFIAAFIKNASEINFLPNPSNIQDYYQKQHQLMMDYNHACLSGK